VNLELSDALLESITKVGRMTECDRVLVIGLPEQERLKPLKKKLIYAVSEPYVAQTLQEADYDVVLLPSYTAGRTDRLKAAIVGAVSSGQLKKGENVICAMGRDEGEPVDTLMHLTASDEQEEHSSLVVTSLKSVIDAQLLEVVVNLALRIGREGYEGRPLGTLIVVGDSTKVMEQSHPLTLNPFQGYSEAERNLFDAHVRDAVRTFAMLDGAFVVRDDGVVLAAGRHIRVGDDVPEVPLGMGARHVAAASISKQSNAIALAVSQSSGDVRIFQDGEIVIEISPGNRRADVNTDVSGEKTQIRVTRKKRSAKKATTASSSSEKTAKHPRAKRKPKDKEKDA
jgi:diadenylate cyclase